MLTYFAVLANMLAYLHGLAISELATLCYVMAVYLSYGVIYLAPVMLPAFALNRIVSWNLSSFAASRFPALKKVLPYGLALLGSIVIQLFLLVDQTIYRMYGYHFNGFVLNLILTPGGIESLGGSTSTTITFSAIIAAIAGIQGFFLYAAIKIGALQRAFEKIFRRWVVVSLIILMIVMGLGERIAYGFSHVLNYQPILASSEAFLFYVPMTFKRFAISLGFKPAAGQNFRLKNKMKAINYPLKPLTRKPVKQLYNIVWLTAESLRDDMVTSEIMPATTAFALKSSWFPNHYSGGNGTRMALFAMFYGLYGNYWKPFLDATRSPVLIDLLLQDNYQIQAYTSAKFSYPEFDKTIWARIPRNQLHESTKAQEGWVNDRENVAKMLEYIDKRDPSRPFFTFMFFESPHARYYFPPESVIRKPYLDDLNYATMNLQRDISLIKNRYINSCHHLDSQYERIYKYLESHNLLDSTIVLIAGDHGEEFMEKGRWGHGSEYVEEQVRTPLILHVPGKAPAQIKELSSHLDIPTTILPLLGVTNPPDDYSLGYDLFGPVRRQFTILSDWSSMAYVDSQYKVTFPLTVSKYMNKPITSADDKPIPGKTTFYTDKKERLAQIMKEMSRFGK